MAMGMGMETSAVRLRGREGRQVEGEEAGMGAR